MTQPTEKSKREKGEDSYFSSTPGDIVPSNQEELEYAIEIPELSHCVRLQRGGFWFAVM